MIKTRMVSKTMAIMDRIQYCTMALLTVLPIGPLRQYRTFAQYLEALAKAPMSCRKR